jgi:hypothetical protein
MANINEVYPSKYLSADDFGGIEGRPALATISHATIEPMDDGKQKINLHLREHKKSLILNKTNAATIAAYAGNDTDDWPGKQVVVFVSMVDYQGKSVESLRVRQPKPQPKQQPAPSPAANSGIDYGYDDPVPL